MLDSKVKPPRVKTCPSEEDICWKDIDYKDEPPTAITDATYVENALRNAEAPVYERVERQSSAPSTLSSLEGESRRIYLERLGRERPAKLTSKWQEIAFIYSVVMSQLLTEYFVSGFPVILPTVVDDLKIPASGLTWPANAFSLAVSAFLLPFGRLADMYGGKAVYVAGLTWMTVWSFAAGFARIPIVLDICRALQGLGAAAFLPSSLMLLGSIYRPGPRKNIVFCIYGALGPFGFFAGIFFAGIIAEYSKLWGCWFWIGAFLGATAAIPAYLIIPSDFQERKAMKIKMDWMGTALISSGLILIVFAVTDASRKVIPAVLVFGILLLAAAACVERWVAEMPLLPFDLFQVKYMKPMILALFFTYGSLGIWLLYPAMYMSNVMGGSPLQLVAWFVPSAIGGCVIATCGGFMLHLIPGTPLIIIAGTSWIVAPLLFALAPADVNYWAWIFPSMICCTLAVDITFNVTNIFITTSLPIHRQGLAGALINSILQLGVAFFLGVAEIIASATENQGIRQSYKNALWFEVACAVVALIIFSAFVRVDRAEAKERPEEIDPTEIPNSETADPPPTYRAAARKQSVVSTTTAARHVSIVIPSWANPFAPRPPPGSRTSWRSSMEHDRWFGM